MPTIIDDATVRSRLAELDGWTLTGGKLRCELAFADFGRAFGFLTRVALLAERHGHHPDIHNSYRRVVLELTTHDAGGITEADLALAAAIQSLLPG